MVWRREPAPPDTRVSDAQDSGSSLPVEPRKAKAPPRSGRTRSPAANNSAASTFIRLVPKPDAVASFAPFGARAPILAENIGTFLPALVVAQLADMPTPQLG